MKSTQMSNSKLKLYVNQIESQKVQNKLHQALGNNDTNRGQRSHVMSKMVSWSYQAYVNMMYMPRPKTDVH